MYLVTSPSRETLESLACCSTPCSNICLPARAAWAVPLAAAADCAKVFLATYEACSAAACWFCTAWSACWAAPWAVSRSPAPLLKPCLPPTPPPPEPPTAPPPPPAGFFPPPPLPPVSPPFAETKWCLNIGTSIIYYLHKNPHLPFTHSLIL